MITEDFINKIFKVSSQEGFNEIALEIFRFQYKNNKVYNQWCNLVSKDIESIKKIEDIPFLPISFFRTHKVLSFDSKPSHFFKSSGTTNTQNSYHYIYDLNIYQKSFIHSYQTFLPNPNDYMFIALLPNYLSQANSSLIYMIDYFIRNSNYKESGFYKDNLPEVISLLKKNKEKGIKTILFATTYALLDLIELERLELGDDVIVFETGGMKGRRKEMIKEELYSILKEGLGVRSIASEYGMCELLSQAYSLDNGVFFTPSQMKVMVRDIHDPFTYIQPNKVGGINVIDLANIYSCSFIATDDLGISLENGGFQIRGRMENSVIRGCNLMYEE
ncbi:MAG: acyltransferase [Bacteroidales bacterium]|nr:acyltransferase [Bacteroidales bacterium]